MERLLISIYTLYTRATRIVRGASEKGEEVSVLGRRGEA